VAIASETATDQELSPQGRESQRPGGTPCAGSWRPEVGRCGSFRGCRDCRPDAPPCSW